MGLTQGTVGPHMLLMDPFETYGLRRVINARGTFTPLGVSRSSEAVAAETGLALRYFFHMGDLHDRTGRIIADGAGAEAAAVCHCAAAAITIACAAVMAGADPGRVARLPDTRGMKKRVVIQAGHLVNYGQPIEQAVRLSGAEVVVAGDPEACSREALDAALDIEGIAALLLVDSRLCKGAMVAPADAVALARERGVPVIVDAAAQDLRMADVLSVGADLTIFSAQKYLAAPTVGLVLGKEAPVAAFRAQDKGIGRGMKASKEAILGLLAAVRERDDEDMTDWREAKAADAEAFAEELDRMNGVSATTVADPTHGPFRRVEAAFGPTPSGRTAADIAAALGDGDPAIFVYDADAPAGRLGFELMALSADERTILLERIRDLVA